MYTTIFFQPSIHLIIKICNPVFIIMFILVSLFTFNISVNRNYVQFIHTVLTTGHNNWRSTLGYLCYWWSEHCLWNINAVIFVFKPTLSYMCEEVCQIGWCKCSVFWFCIFVAFVSFIKMTDNCLAVRSYVTNGKVSLTEIHLFHYQDVYMTG